MRRYIPLLLAIVLLLSACGTKNTDPAQTPIQENKPSAQSSQKTEQPEMFGSEADQNVPVETDWLSLYAPVFDSYKELFAAVDAYKQGSEAPADLSGSDYDLESNLSLFLESQAKPGFCLQDLDGNGTPELIMGLMTDDFFYSRIIAGLFTIEDGSPKQVFTSYTRSRYCLSSLGGFIYEGSGGAAYSDYYQCGFSGNSLKVDHGVYSDGDRGFFYCEGGDRESAPTQESISEAQFAEYFNKLDSMIIDPPEYTMLDFGK